jgi:adenylate kinase
MKIMLMGAPASGKGTVGAIVSKKLNIPIFSVGDLLRDIPESSLFYQPLHKSMDAGDLAPNSIPAGAIREELKKDIYKDGFLLDGWMRDLEQKDYFDPNVNLVILIAISRETAMKRISGRRFCPKDDFSCNIYTLPPKDPNKCDKCGGELIQRKDDTEEVAKHRFELYKKDVLPVVEYYRKQGNLLEIDGEGTPDEVADLVLAALKKRDFN